MALFNLFRKRAVVEDDDAEQLEALPSKVVTHPSVDELPGPDGVPARHLTAESLRYLRGDFNVDDLLKGIGSMDAADVAGYEDVLAPEAEEIPAQADTPATEREAFLMKRLGDALEENRTLAQRLEEVTGKSRITHGNLLRYRTHFEITHEACLFTSADLLIIKEANAAAAYLLDKTAAQLSGTPLTLFVAPDDRAQLRTFVLSLLSDNTAAMRISFVGKGGKQVPLLLNGALVRDDERVYGVVINALPLED